MECEVKWALGTITMNKASGGDGIPVELFQILKIDTVKVLHSICQQIWKTQQWPQGWKRSVFIPIPNKGNAKEWHTDYHTIASKVMLKFYKPGFNSMCTVNFQMFKLDLERKRNQRSNCQHLLKHQKNKRVPEIHLLLLYWLRQSLCVDHNKLWKILKEMGTPKHLTCLPRSLCACQEATVRTWHGTMDWFQTGKGVCQGCILSP